MHPILFHLPDFLGGSGIPTYGVLMALGMLLGASVFALQAAWAGADRGKAFEFALEVMLISLISSKLVGLMFQPPSDLPLLELIARTGGVWYVGFLTGVFWARIRMRTLGIGVLHGLDMAAAAVASGHALGRLGCFFAGCCWGSACDGPLSVTFTDDAAHRLTGVPLGIPLHPVQLYEAGAEALTAIGLILWIRSGRYRFALQPGLTYLIVYAIVRFVMETMRDDPRGGAGGLSTSQIIGLAVLGVAVPLYVIGLVRGSIDPRRPRKPRA